MIAPRQNWKRGIAARAFDKDEGEWRALAGGKEKESGIGLAQARCQEPVHHAAKPERFLLLLPLFSGLFNLSWMFLPVACLAIFHITHFSLQGKQTAKVEFLASDSGCCWQRVEVKRIQPYYQPTALEAFLSPKRRIKKGRDRGETVYIYCPYSIRLAMSGFFFFFNPLWG